jgi:hypothetical protein
MKQWNYIELRSMAGVCFSLMLIRMIPFAYTHTYRSRDVANVEGTPQKAWYFINDKHNFMSYPAESSNLSSSHHLLVYHVYLAF